MLTRRTATAPGFVAVVVSSAGSAQCRRPQEEVLTAEAERLAAHASGPEGAGALAALATLDEDVDPQALESAVRAGVGEGRAPAGGGAGIVVPGASRGPAGPDRGGGVAASVAGSAVAHLRDRAVRRRARQLRTRRFRRRRRPPAPDLAEPYRARHANVGWRSGNAAMRDGVLYLDGMLRPADQAVAYVVAFVRSERDRAAVLRLGSQGPIKVWVNGAAVFTHDVVRPPSLDQDAVSIRLGRGLNSILIKTVISDGAWRVLARVADAAGRVTGVARRRGWRRRCPATMARRASSAICAARRHAGRVAGTSRAPARGGGGPRLGRPGARARVDDAARCATTGPRPWRSRRRSSCCSRRVPRSRRRSRPCGWPRPKRRTTTTSAGGCWSRRSTRSRLRNGARCCWRAWACTARAARRDARALEAWREALAIDPEVLAGGAGDRPGRSGRRAAAHRRDPPGGAAAAFSRALPRRAAARPFACTTPPGRRREANRVLADLAQRSPAGTRT